MEFKNLYQKYVDEINDRMYVEKEIFLQELTNFAPKSEHLFKQLIETTSGGKRIRGFLILLANEIFGGKNHEATLKIAIAYEIFQSSILIHDDIIDSSSTRRGIPTIHYALGNNHYGISQAICLGDIGFFWAMRIINSIEIESEIKSKITEIFINMMIKTGLGEILDLETSMLKNIEISDIEKLHYYKTAIYTLIGPLKLGAVIANTTEDQIILLEEIGKNLGLAFQIKDDVIGIFNDEKLTGKSAKSDIEEKKITHMYLHSLNHSEDQDLDLLNEIYGKKNISTNEVDSIKQIFERNGALSKSNELIVDYSNKANEKIAELNISENYKNILLSFSDYLCKREN